MNPVTLAELEDAISGPRVTLPMGTDAAVNRLVAGAASAAKLAAHIEHVDAEEAGKPATLDPEMADIEPDPVKWVHWLIEEVDRLNERACGS